MIPVIPAEWPMCMEMIQKLPVFVSHMYNCSHASNSCIFIHVPQTMTFDWVLRGEPEVSLSGYKLKPK